MKLSRLIVSAILATACSTTLADVKLASVFTDHMVLQRNKPVRVWGTATPNKSVTVKIAGNEASATADDQGHWQLELPKHDASATPATLTASEEGGNTATLSDVLFGDVWICSGQSNMEFGLPRASNAADAIPHATDDKLRLLVVPHNVQEEPQSQQAGQWVVCSPETAQKFSAVGYFFGQQIRADQHVPVGLVGTYWGGTPAEAWTPASYLQGDQWQPIHDRDKASADQTARAVDYDRRVKQWESKPEATRGPKPTPPRRGKNPHLSSVLWNGMVQPLLPMTIEGVIWYQGEANAGRAEQYRTLFPNMIQAWRDQFKQGDFPFLFVQLANYKNKGDTPAGSAWAELREAQAMTLKLPNTGMAVTIDIGNPTNIHPTDKLTVGKRLALAAQHVAYHKDVTYQGPTYDSMDVSDHTITLHFDHATGLTTKDDAPVKGFMVAGDDQKFVPAESAKIDGDKVILTAPTSIEKPTAVRYGWAADPETSLYNAAHLPMVPFRTDDWPMATAGKK